jgi:hypothetical protein
VPEPPATTAERFVWVVQYFAKAGFIVMIDAHTEDPTPASASPAEFGALYADIVKKISVDPVAAKSLIVDIINEPDARGWGWDTVTPKYLAVMDAVHAVNPEVLFVVEGCGQGFFLGTNWGDGER